jgi:hypothetical protein
VGRIVLSIAGPWTEAPALRTDVDCRFGPADPELAATVESVGRRAQVLDDHDVSAIHRHTGVIDAVATSPEAAARLMVEAFAAGACAAYVETAVKVFAAGSLKNVDPDDRVSLFHLFVEVWGNDAEVSTEGMQAFDLPDVAVPYTRANAGPAQAAAFTLAARMVCDRTMPTEGERFRASRSAPWYTASRRAAESGDDEYANPEGFWVLSLEG